MAEEPFEVFLPDRDHGPNLTRCRRSLAQPQSWRVRNPRKAQFVVEPTTNRRLNMLRGALLWLIGIPLPIILILFFMGWLS
jgi:hypothetical protein